MSAREQSRSPDERDDDGRPDPTTTTAITLKAAGLTVVGVLVSIGVTVGFGLTATWWVRVLAAVGVTVALAVVVKLMSASPRGPLSRLANWILGAPHPP